MRFDVDYFLSVLPMVVGRLNITLALTGAAMVFSLLLGLILALISYYKVPILSQLLKVWVAFMRSTPALVQLLFFYYGLARVSKVILNMDQVVAVAVVMSLNMGAFMSESIRAALLSVDIGQHEAAMSLGMSGFQMITRIIIPQAFRVAVPPLFNDLINLFKMSSLAYLIGLQDVMGAAKIQMAMSFKFFECYACVMLVYLVIGAILTVIQKRVEKKCATAY